MTTYNASEIDRLVREGTDVYSRNRPGLVADMVAALSAAKAEAERLRASLSLAQTREQQATEMCTWLTGENQRLRDVVALSEHLDADIDEVLADAEDDCVSRVIAENEVTASPPRSRNCAPSSPPLQDRTPIRRRCGARIAAWPGSTWMRRTPSPPRSRG